MIFENMDRIVFAGDSVTDMGSTNPVGEGLFDSLGKGYVRLVESMLAAWYPELALRITNSAISGNTSRDLLNRFDRDVVDLNPDWVSICVGINDVWRQFDVPAFKELMITPEEYESNIEQMILKVKDKVKGVFLITPYLIEVNREDMLRARMDVYSDICRRLAAKHGCTLIDFQKMFEEYCRIRHSCCLAWDRVHPNQMGSMLMAREFLKHCGFDYNE